MIAAMDKLYLSVDIEGVACIAAPAEADMAQTAQYAPFAAQMSDEAAAASAGAFDAGVGHVVVKDAHGSGRNIDPRRLVTPPDKRLELIRGWSGHPLSMVQDIDPSFGAAAFVGFHSAAGRGGNPLAHTVSGRMFARVELNGAVASEFRLYGLAAATVGVPVCFVSGDRALCDEAERSVDGIVTVATLVGSGPSVRSLLPDEALRQIRDGVRRAITSRLPQPMAVPGDVHFKLVFARASDAYAKSFFPGARQVTDTELVMETTRYLDALTFLKFAALA